MKSTKWMKLALLAGMLALIILLAGCNPKPDNSGQTGNTGVGTIGDDLFPTFSVGPSGTATPTAVIVTPEIVPPSSESPPISTNAGWADITLPTGDYPTPTYAPATSVPPIQTPQPTATPAPTSSALRLGSKGDRVRSVQSRLKALGYLKGSVDGDFGKATESALKAFQKRNKLTADGIVGQATIAKLNSPNAIKAQPTASPTPRPTATPRINANTYLRLGSSGSDVRKMQSRLIELGYLEGKATGYFNEATEAAVIAFQKRNVSYSDGVAGPMTLEALYSSKAKRASSFAGIVGTSLKRGMTDSAAVRSMQQKLKSLGYYTGGIDGDFGASTELAVRAFQQQHRIKVDGIAGEGTLNLLFSKDAKRAGAQTPTPTLRPPVTMAPQFTPITNYVIVTPDPNGGYVTLRPGDAGALVRNLQQSLKSQGYLDDEADGKYGLATFEAVKRFQAKHGLSQDGIAGPATQRILYEGNFPKGA